MKLPAFFEQDHRLVDAELDRLLPPEKARPPLIHRAMRYSIFAGGKRVRPILCIEAFRIFSDEITSVLPVACSLEFIHTYSLIHDDLPALDNDDLRRGQPTCHKKFGEAMAILAGDALLTLAFERLAAAPIPPAQGVALIKEIASAAGTIDGMVGGQVADLEAGGKQVTPEMLQYIHCSKTAALIRASIVSGAIAGGACPQDLERLRTFGGLIGWAFQVTDDILDVEESSAALGKTAGKDQAQQKATYPALFGLKKSHEFARDLATRAITTLEPFGARAANLRELGEFLVLRRA
ncbi:MAG TPA: farnesyl diphosphate synthase [Candidatus Acidoferrales bacterium]|nr:farnesyl diphosphate synthase [Candidatus Acidoferrales bacterium]